MLKQCVDSVQPRHFSALLDHTAVPSLVHLFIHSQNAHHGPLALWSRALDTLHYSLQEDSWNSAVLPQRTPVLGRKGLIKKNQNLKITVMKRGRHFLEYPTINSPAEGSPGTFS